MRVELPLAEMSVAEKLSAMESLWDDLCRSGQVIPAPAWHGEVLAEREQMIAEGRASFSDWAEARERVTARCHEDQNPRPR